MTAEEEHFYTATCRCDRCELKLKVWSDWVGKIEFDNPQVDAMEFIWQVETDLRIKAGGLVNELKSRGVTLNIDRPKVELDPDFPPGESHLRNPYTGETVGKIINIGEDGNE